MRDVCQNNTGGVSGRYGSVEHQHGSSGAMMRGVLHARMCGCVKADDDDMQVRMLGRVNSMRQVTDVRVVQIGLWARIRKCVGF